MGYIFVLISVLSGTTKGYCGKKTSEFMKNPVDGIFETTYSNSEKIVVDYNLGELRLAK